MKLKLTIKELADIVNVPPSTIRYYNNIGIFKHSGTFDNGYRYFDFERIEEIRLIIYLRHIGISLKEIEKHIANRNINEYESILKKQLQETREQIDHLHNLEKRLEKRIEYMDYIHNLPEINTISVEHMEKRKLLKFSNPDYDQHDYEIALVEFERLGDLPPSLIIGEQGFIVDLNKWDRRRPEEFSGMYMLGDDPYIDDHVLLSEYPEGDWLTVCVKGGHDVAARWYGKLMSYAEDYGLILEDHALERILIDHYISNDPSFYITEIQIPVKVI